MATLAELVAQKEALEQAILSMRAEARTEAVAKVQALMSEHGLTAADITIKHSRSVGAGKRSGVVPVKYRDQAGNSWTGRGLKPKWLAVAIEAGKKLEDFLV